MNKTITWFEIPVKDLERARAFYESVLGQPLRIDEFEGSPLVVFPHDRNLATGGCLAPGAELQPSAEGVRIYLDVGDALDPVLNRVPAAGGSISKPRTALPPGMGSYAHIIDSEGNCVGLHAAA